MKNILNTFLKVGVLSLLVWSCKKDETRAIVNAGTAPGLASSGTTFTLTKAAENNTAVTFTITPANFGYEAAVAYTLQFAKPGTNFAAPYNIQLPDNKTTQTLSVKQLNIAALNAGLDTNSAQPVQVRLKADIGSGRAALYSTPLSFTVKPYSLNAFMYVPGDYQGWDPGSAPRLISINSTGKFDGYINITAGSLEFKVTDAPDWNHGIFGDAATSGTSGQIASPGNNFKVATPGYYKFHADLTSNPGTWSATKTSWSIIGDLTGWGSDLDMTYNPATQVWTGTVTFPSTPGQFKFRANHDWGLNYGDSNGDSILEDGGGNINGLSGTHTVTLDLHVPGAYKYTIQ
jgi:hypothetical protein